jgi:uncharacterized protein
MHTSILPDILSSRTRAEFFTLLFGLDSSEYHLREIERRSGLAIGTVRQEAAKLVGLGLIDMRRSSNRTYYRANAKHPLYRTIHELVLKTSGLADILRESLSTGQIDYAFVFGSIAAGGRTPNDGIELCVLGDISLRALGKMLQCPATELGRDITPHIMTVQECVQRKENNDDFVVEVLNSPKLMVIGEEEELAMLDVLVRKAQIRTPRIVPAPPDKTTSALLRVGRVLDALKYFQGTRG